MKSNKAEIIKKEWDRLKEEIIPSFRMSWQETGHLRIEINSVGPDSKELPIEERRQLLWNVLKDNYHEDEVEEVSSPNGDKTYLKKYLDFPFFGVANYIYSYGETNVHVFFYLGPRLGLLHIYSKDAGVDYEEIRELINDSLNKTMAKHSLSVSLSSELSTEDIDRFLDFIHDPVKQNHFPK